MIVGKYEVVVSRDDCDNLRIIRAQRLAIQATIFSAEDVAGDLQEREDLVWVAGGDDCTELELRPQLFHCHAISLKHLVPHCQHLKFTIPALLVIKRHKWTGWRFQTHQFHQRDHLLKSVAEKHFDVILSIAIDQDPLISEAFLEERSLEYGRAKNDLLFGQHRCRAHETIWEFKLLIHLINLCLLGLATAIRQKGKWNAPLSLLWWRQQLYHGLPSPRNHIRAFNDHSIDIRDNTWHLYCWQVTFGLFFDSCATKDFAGNIQCRGGAQKSSSAHEGHFLLLFGEVVHLVWQTLCISFTF